MKFSSCIKLSLLAFFTFFSIPNVSANTSQAAEPITQEQQTALNQMLAKHIEHLTATDRLLQDLLLLIDGSSSFSSKNKPEIRTNLLELRDLITNLAGDTPVQAEVPHVIILGFLSQRIMQHLIMALDNHLTTLPPFDLQKAMNDLNSGLQMDFVELVEINTKLAQQLSDKVSTAGLRWYNKAYRVFDKTIIQPSVKYNLPTRAMTALGTGLAAGYLWWHSSSDNETMRSWFGWAPRMLHGETDIEAKDKNGKLWHLTHPVKWPGEIERTLRSFNTGAMPLGTLAAGALLYHYRNELGSAGIWAGNKIQKFHNFMKGGVFYRQFEKPEVKFMANPRITFKDIIGMDQAKESLMRIVKYLENPERQDGSKIGPEKGYLLTGPARSGKTNMAEGLAGEIKAMFKRKGKNPDDFNFFSLNATFVMQEGIKNLIDRAKQYSPCIIFIDEIDLLGLQRGGTNIMLSEFLTAMSGCLDENPDKVVIIIGATNKPENLDFALRQRGRFGKEIRFEYPNFNERKAFLESKLSKLANVRNFDLEKLARETEGKSFEDLHAIIKAGFQHSLQEGKVLTHQLLESAFDEEVRNIVDNNALAHMPEQEKKIIAVHQAGRALATVLLGFEKLAKVTIKPYLAKLKEENPYDQFYIADDQQQKKIRYGKTYTFHGQDVKNIHGLEQKVAICKELLAGYAAERIILGSCGYGYEAESGQQALDMCKSIVSEGVDIKQLPADLQNKYFEKALVLKQQYEKEVQQLLEQHKPTLQKIADALMKQQSLTGVEVANIAGLAPVKPVVQAAVAA